jgi:hypothetical protein
MKNKNYQDLMEKELTRIRESGMKPKLLIHSCCAPCSSYAVELLKEYFEITLYFYNPNIFPESEHNRRYEELVKFIGESTDFTGVKVIFENYSPIDFAGCSLGLENEREGGLRCFNCYDLRLSKTAQKAKDMGFDYFATTLTISPHKNSEKINEIGNRLTDVYEVKFLNSDFKKKDGFKRSLEISRKYELYRQDYCGCEYSLISKTVE